MDASRFDRFTRALITSPARRDILQGFVAAALGLASIPLVGTVRAKKRKKKLILNEFGCVDVGGKCRGRADVCCSGICQGKRPKKGKRDKRRCVAHDTDGCQVGQNACGAGGEHFMPVGCREVLLYDDREWRLLWLRSDMH
ncbi:MAG: hypothetical protein ACRDJC_10315 [Thermomicrobiales bacterium]